MATHRCGSHVMEALLKRIELLGSPQQEAAAEEDFTAIQASFYDLCSVWINIHLCIHPYLIFLLDRESVMRLEI